MKKLRQKEELPIRQDFNVIGNFLYRKAGAGKPCAGHRIDIVSLLCTLIGRVSIDDNLGDVAEIGSEGEKQQVSRYIEKRNNCKTFEIFE